MLWEGFNSVSCVDCGRKSKVKNCYGEEMCYECHSIYEEQDGQRIPKERSDEGLVE
jgi:hypothetical protein